MSKKIIDNHIKNIAYDVVTSIQILNYIPLEDVNPRLKVLYDEMCNICWETVGSRVVIDFTEE